MTPSVMTTNMYRTPNVRLRTGDPSRVSDAMPMRSGSNMVCCVVWSMLWCPSITTRQRIVHNQEWRRLSPIDGISVMEWDSPAIVLDARPYGEGDAVATVMTEAHGLHRGLARGGASRGKAATWQAGNLVHVRWTARLSDQLGSFSGELIHPGAA